MFGSIGEWLLIHVYLITEVHFLFVESYGFFTYILAKKLRMIVISVGYRLSPEHLYPGPFDDCWKTTEYIFKNAKSLKIDTNRIVLCGDSAGNGYLI